MRKIAKTVKQMIDTPPMTPPIIGPMGDDELLCETLGAAWFVPNAAVVEGEVVVALEAGEDVVGGVFAAVLDGPNVVETPNV